MTSGFNIGFVAGRPRRFLYAWGSNGLGQTGLGTSSGSTTTPARVGTTGGWSVVSGAVPWSAGIRGRRLFGWGLGGANGLGGASNTPQQNGVDFDWFNLSVAGVNSDTFFGSERTVFAVGINAERLFSYGANIGGATGQGTTAGNTTTPTQIGSATGWTAVATGGSNGFGTGPHQSLAILNGELYSFGSNSNGITGLGTTTGNTTTPTRVGSDSDWTVVAAGHAVSLGIRNGELYAWGSNGRGATGLGTTTGNTTTPTRVGSATGWTAAATSFGSAALGSVGHSIAVLNGELYGFGNNENGRTGLGTTSGNTTTPTKIGSQTGWTHVACGINYSIAIRAGELYSFGSNANGRTGLGTASGNTTTPARVGTASDWLSVATGSNSSFGIKRKA